MRKIFSIISMLCCFCMFAETKAPDIFQVDISSAKQYLNMANQAANGTMLTESDWNNLFASPAYKALFTKVDWNKDEFENNVKNAFNIVYDPSKTTLCDSIARQLDNIDLSTLESELPFFVSTALSVKNNLQIYSSILESFDTDKVVTEANKLALSLVPNNGAGLEPESCPIYFIVWDLECRALGDALFLDVNTFFHDGLQAATESLAHEMHHFYLMPVFNTVYKDDVMDGAVLFLVNNMREGVADILNKKQMPLTSLAPYGKRMLEIYNADYENSPEVLAEIDKITCDYLDGKLDMEQYFQKSFGCVHFEGHTTGDYMVFLIRDQLGVEAVVESVGDLDKFIDNYNIAAEKAGKYKFSDRFTEHIHKVSTSAKR